MRTPSTIALRIGRKLRHLLRGAQARLRRLAAPRQMQQHDKLHLGCGPRHLEGWANVDISPAAQIVWDLRKPLPVSSVSRVYSEHFIEHIGREDAVRLLANVRRVLTDEGVVRISTPDLAALVEDYRAGILADMPEDGWQPQTLCQMLNEGMREWGHVFLYDEPELRGVLAEAGFRRIERVRHGESAHAELRNLESRPDLDDLILEARP